MTAEAPAHVEAGALESEGPLGPSPMHVLYCFLAFHEGSSLVG
jgi:hypothetical protein